ncbi:MAG: LrgB family protein [Lachnospiraceae bacterium]|nr:LrgB family protein [Lachnospiraceae bacterium]
MNDFLTDSVFFGAIASLAFYEIGLLLKKKLKKGWVNPLLISIVLTIGLLLAGHIDYATYYEGAKYISYLLTPATVCLAIPLYEQFELLKKHHVAVLAGIVSGVLTSAVIVLLFAICFRFSHAEYVTFLPKSITTAIGMGVSEQLGGYVPITVVVIIVTGIMGNVLAEPLCKLFRIHEPIARGVAIGSASHALGTAKAIEMGEVEGAMSSLSIAVAGILTVVASLIFAQLY